MYSAEYDDYWWETHNSILHVAMSQIILGETEQAPHWSWQRPMSQEMFVSYVWPNVPENTPIVIIICHYGAFLSLVPTPFKVIIVFDLIES